MLKALFLSLAVLLSGCAAAPENTVSVTISNMTTEPLVIKCGSSIFGTSVVIQPKATWSGTIDRRWVSSSGWVIVEQLKRDKPQ